MTYYGCSFCKKKRLPNKTIIIFDEMTAVFSDYRFNLKIFRIKLFFNQCLAIIQFYFIYNVEFIVCYARG